MSENDKPLKTKKPPSRLKWFLIGVLFVFGGLVVMRVPIVPIEMEMTCVERGGITNELSYYAFKEKPRSEFMHELRVNMARDWYSFSYVHKKGNEGGIYLPVIRMRSELIRKVIKDTAAEFVERKTGRKFSFYPVSAEQECDELRTIIIEGKVPERALWDNP